MMIYKLHNKINGKVYIGQTLTSLKIRMQNHIGECNRKRSTKCLITKAIIEFGVENFEIKELYKTNSIEELNQKETEYIIHYNSNNPEFGYNQNTGGRKGSVLNDEVKKRISDRVKAYALDAVRKGTHSSLGRKPTPEKTKKVSEKLKSESNPKNIPILKYDLSGNFICKHYSTRSAARDLGLDTAANIISCCKGRIKSAYGFLWKYESLTMV